MKPTFWSVNTKLTWFPYIFIVCIKRSWKLYIVNCLCKLHWMVCFFAMQGRWLTSCVVVFFGNFKPVFLKITFCVLNSFFGWNPSTVHPWWTVLCKSFYWPGNTARVRNRNRLRVSYGNLREITRNEAMLNYAKFRVKFSLYFYCTI